jgi:hypothetical protein
MRMIKWDQMDVFSSTTRTIEDLMKFGRKVHLGRTSMTANTLIGMYLTFGSQLPRLLSRFLQMDVMICGIRSCGEENKEIAAVVQETAFPQEKDVKIIRESSLIIWVSLGKM